MSLLAEDRGIAPPEPPEDEQDAIAVAPRIDKPRTIKKKSIKQEPVKYCSVSQFELGKIISLTPPENISPFVDFTVFQITSDDEMIVKIEFLHDKEPIVNRGNGYAMQLDNTRVSAASMRMSTPSKEKVKTTTGMFIFRQKNISKGNVTGSSMVFHGNYKIIDTETYKTIVGSNTLFVIEKVTAQE